MSAETVTCISWNIHRGRGGDGRVDPDRVMDVLASEVWETGTDALCLQEADAEDVPHAGVLDIARVQVITGLVHVHTARATRSTDASHGFLGVVTFLHPRWSVDAVRLVDLPGLCPRGAVVVEAQNGTARVRLCNTHLSLSQPLRIVQMRTLGQHICRHRPRPTILCGDFNEWRPWGGLALSPRVLTETYRGPTLRTFPVGRPLFPLDRILASAPSRVTDVTVFDGSGIRAASDHRPIRGRIVLAPEKSEISDF